MANLVKMAVLCCGLLLLLCTPMSTGYIKVGLRQMFVYGRAPYYTRDQQEQPQKRTYQKNRAIPEVACGCRSKVVLKDLGEGYYPQYIRDAQCIMASCPAPYKCSQELYYITVFKERSYVNEEGDLDLPRDVSEHIIAKTVNVTVACHCNRMSMSRP